MINSGRPMLYRSKDGASVVEPSGPDPNYAYGFGLLDLSTGEYHQAVSHAQTRMRLQKTVACKSLFAASSFRAALLQPLMFISRLPNRKPIAPDQSKAHSFLIGRIPQAIPHCWLTPCCLAALSFANSSFALETYDDKIIPHHQQKALCFRVTSSETQFRASLVWTDPAGSPYGGGRALVHDLDLTVVDTSNKFYYGNGWRVTTEVGV